jgi:hypothetical protein
MVKIAPKCARPGCKNTVTPNVGRRGGFNKYCSLDCGRFMRAEGLRKPKIAGKPIDETILSLLKHGEQTPNALALRTGATPGQVLDTLLSLKNSGKNLYVFGDRWTLEREPKTGGTFAECLVSDNDGWHKFGAIGDTHLCSKQERLEELHDIYRIFEANGIRNVLHTGNYIDGEARFNKHELKVHGLDAQLAYMGEHYPENKGIRTLMVSGDDHEGWYGQREGIDIGFTMQSVMERGGRRDLINLGYMECFIPLKHAKTGVTSMVHVVHPGGGSAYAISYTMQKQIEAYEGGEKPTIVLAGHYHKSDHLYIRNVHGFQTGCFQDQTIFMRKKKLSAAIGGWVLFVRQNPETGAVEDVVSYWKGYYNRGYYVNQRWSLSGPVTKVPRIAA